MPRLCEQLRVGASGSDTHFGARGQATFGWSNVTFIVSGFWRTRANSKLICIRSQKSAAPPNALSRRTAISGVTPCCPLLTAHAQPRRRLGNGQAEFVDVLLDKAAGMRRGPSYARSFAKPLQ